MRLLRRRLGHTALFAFMVWLAQWFSGQQPGWFNAGTIVLYFLVFVTFCIMGVSWTTD